MPLIVSERNQRQALYLFDPATERVIEGWEIKVSPTGITPKMINEALAEYPGALTYVEELPYEGDEPIGETAVATITEGVDGIQPSPSGIYCHLTLTGPNGDSPPTLAADGVAAVVADIKLTAADDINADALPIDKNWLILVRRTDGMGYENIPISITQGVGSTNFSTSTPTDFEVRQSDFKPQDLSAYGLGEVAIKLRIYPEQPESPDGVARMYAYRS